MFDLTCFIYGNRYMTIVRHDKSDYYRGTPWGEVLNPLRYQINFGIPPRFTINKNAKWNMRLSNLTWKLWGKRAYEKRRTRNTGEST